MNHKDLKKAQDNKVKEERNFSTWLKTAKERGSRPRVTRNILQTETVIDRIEEDINHCVVNDCTHDWGGDINE